MKETAKGCHEELRTLRAYYSELIRQFPDLEPTFTSWVREINKIQSQPDIETLKHEQQLDALALGFRTLWLRSANRYASSILKSPLHFNLPENIAGETCNFPYDRWAKKTHFEKKYGDKLTLIPEWNAQHLFFGNAMSALLTCFLQIRNSLGKERISIFGKKGYFEISSVMEFIGGKDVSARFTTDQERCNALLKKGYGDVFLFEPVYADDALTVWNMDFFIKAWQERPNKSTTLLVIDTTLCGNQFDLKSFLSRLDPSPPAMVIDISSALKLRQMGLEFANLGILSIYTPKNFEKGRFQRKLSSNIEKARQTFGTGSNFAECLALELPISMNNRFYSDHCQKVFKNNALLAQKMNRPKGMLKRVMHPSLSTDKDLGWAVAPYVLFQLHREAKEDKRFLKYLLQNEAKKRRLTFQSGSSFGFRSHRFEMSIKDAEGDLTFRVAMGARKGPSFDGVITLLKDLLSYETFTDLRDAFSEIPQHTNILDVENLRDHAS